MHRPGVVVGKVGLVDHVWDPAFGADTNVVEVYVGDLRRKTEVPSARRSLETVRGVDYRVVADA